MAINDLHIQQFHKNFLEARAKEMIWRGLTNSDFQGDFNMVGDTVHYFTPDNVTVRDYTRGAGLQTEYLDGTGSTIAIDRQKYYSFMVPDVDALFAAPGLADAHGRNAATQIEDNLNDSLALRAITQGTEAISSGSAVSLTTVGGAYDTLVSLMTQLNKSKVSKSGRWAVVPHDVHALLVKDERFVSYGTSANDERLRNGIVGEAAGFRIIADDSALQGDYVSSLVIVCGHNDSFTLAEKMAPIKGKKVETLRSTDEFGDIVRGLSISGSKVVRPDGVLYTEVAINIS